MPLVKIRPLATGASTPDIVRALNLVYTALTNPGFIMPGLTLTLPLLLPDGTVGTPGLTFTSDPNTGLYHLATGDDVGMSTGGALNTEWKRTGSVNQLLVSNGAVGTPGLAFISEPDNGLFYVGTDDIGWSSGGQPNTEWKRTGSVNQLLLSDGSPLLPGLAFTSDPDTGLRPSAANKAALVAGATDVLTWLLDGNGVELGIGGTTPTVALHVVKSQPGNYVVILQNTNAAAGGKGLSVQTAGTAAADAALLVTTGGVDRFAVNNDGSIVGAGAQPLQRRVLMAAASAALTLTGTPQAVVGASLSLAPGSWAVSGSFHFTVNGAADVGIHGVGHLATTGGTAIITGPGADCYAYFPVAGAAVLVTRVWQVDVTATATVLLQASKTGGTGTSACRETYSTITATYAGNT